MLVLLYPVPSRLLLLRWAKRKGEVMSMKTASRPWTPFLAAWALASLTPAIGCSFDANQLRPLSDGAVEHPAVPDASSRAAAAAPSPARQTLPATGGSGGSAGTGGAGGMGATSGAGGISGVGGITSSGIGGGGSSGLGTGGEGDAGVPDAPAAQPDVPIGVSGGGAGDSGLGGTGGRGDAEAVDTPVGQPDVPVGSADSGVDGAGGTCGGGANTTISGVVYDPAGMNPLYNVIVSIPSAALSPFPAGVSCASCASQVSGQPIATAMTDAKGHFVIGNVPWGASFPLVMQLGKWRRQITIPASMVAKQCADNPIADTWTSTTPATLLRLPKNIHDGDNNGQYTSMPKIAIAAGNAQSSDLTATERLQCLLRRIGVDASEFTLPSGSGSVRLYNQSKNSDTCNTISGITGTFPDATTSLWDKQADLNQYDVILLNCGGAEEDPTTTSGQAFIPNPAAVNLMEAYVNAGGRVFAEHFHWVWIRSFTGYPSTFGPVATWYNDPNEPNPGTGQIGTLPARHPHRPVVSRGRGVR